jgi:hypothetical protein
MKNMQNNNARHKEQHILITAELLYNFKRTSVGFLPP